MKGVRRNAAINVVGNIIPMLAALVAMPMLLNGLGAPRMGLFALALGLFGFAGIFDLGLGRALTRTVAHHAQDGVAPERIAPLLRSGLLVVLVMGLAWGTVLWLGSDWIVSRIRVLGDTLRAESHAGLLILACLIPVALLSTSLVGILEGLQRFWRANAIRVPLGVATYLVPAIVAQWMPTLVAVVGALAIVRLLGMLVLLRAVAMEIPLRATRGPDPLPMAPMWRYTGWLSISNIVGPLMVYGDRYYLATLLPPASIAYYTVPLDTMMRATSLPGAALNAAFPALTRAQSQPGTAQRYFTDANTLLLFAWLVPLAVIGILLPDALRLWLGPEHGQGMLATSRLILAGVLVNGFALVPFNLLQAVGRSDLTAKLHAVELPLFAIGLMLLVTRFGVAGAALAWSLRVAFDGICLVLLARRLFPDTSRHLLRLALYAMLGTLVVLGSMALHATAIRVGAALLVVLLAVGLLYRHGGLAWFLSLVKAHR